MLRINAMKNTQKQGKGETETETQPYKFSHTTVLSDRVRENRSKI